MEDIKERRRYKRVKGDFNVRIKIEEDDYLKINQGKSINVSAGGILVQYDKPIELGKIINVRFLRPNSFEFFEGNARIVRCELSSDNNDYLIGIEFIGLSNGDLKKLDFFLISTSDMGNKKIKVSIEPTWNIVLNINDRIDEVLPDAEDTVVDSLRMVSTELVENAVKFGEPVVGLTGIKYELSVEDNKIIVKVDNGLITKESLMQVKKRIDKIASADDRFKLYTGRLSELMKETTLSESRLGLYRIAYEGKCDLSYIYKDNILSVMAEIQL